MSRRAPVRARQAPCLADPGGQTFRETRRMVLSLAESAKKEAFPPNGDSWEPSIWAIRPCRCFRPCAACHPPLSDERAERRVTLRELTSLEQLHELGERTARRGGLRKVDVAAPKGIPIVEWYRTPLVAAMPKDHPRARAALRSVHLSDLKDEPFIMYPRGAGRGSTGRSSSCARPPAFGLAWLAKCSSPRP